MLRPYSYTQHQFKVNFGNIQYLTSSQADWLQEDENAADFIKNKPSLVAGDNIVITRNGNVITISATGTVTPDEPEPPVSDKYTNLDYIIDNQIPFFVGVDGEFEEYDFTVLDRDKSEYTQSGLYVGKNTDNLVISGGYQIPFSMAESEETEQSFLIPKGMKIITAYQYSEAFERYLEMGFDGTYWYEDGEVEQEVNGQTYTYTKYTYNKDLIGAPIESSEYWRFEMEVIEWLE